MFILVESQDHYKSIRIIFGHLEYVDVGSNSSSYSIGESDGDNLLSGVF